MSTSTKAARTDTTPTTPYEMSRFQGETYRRILDAVERCVPSGDLSQQNALLREVIKELLVFTPNNTLARNCMLRESLCAGLVRGRLPVLSADQNP